MVNINDPIEELECAARVEGAKYGKENRIRQLPKDASRLTKLELLMWYSPVNERAIEWAKLNIEGFQRAIETDPYVDYKPVRRAIRVVEAFRNAAIKEQPNRGAADERRCSQEAGSDQEGARTRPCA